MSLRLFAAITIPEHVSDRLVPLQKGVPGAKWRPRENFHLTLRFFGEVNERTAEDIDAELASISAAAFELQLAGTGHFGQLDPRAIWVGAKPEAELDRLQSRCEKAARRAGLPADKRKFCPHVTLAYLSGTPVEKVETWKRKLALFSAPGFRVGHFSLYASWPKRGGQNIYEELETYPLSVS